MTFANIDRRLRRIEADRHSGAPTRIMADRPMDEAEAADALANWRAWLADGRASISGNALCILGPEMTMEAWDAAHARERETLH